MSSRSSYTIFETSKNTKILLYLWRNPGYGGQLYFQKYDTKVRSLANVANWPNVSSSRYQKRCIRDRFKRKLLHRVLYVRVGFWFRTAPRSYPQYRSSLGMLIGCCSPIIFSFYVRNAGGGVLKEADNLKAEAEKKRRERRELHREENYVDGKCFGIPWRRVHSKN